MYLNDLNSSQHNVDKLNKILANTFKHDVNLSEMSTDSLNRMLNTTNAKMMAIKESDLTYWENAQYNKLGLIAHQLKTYITEIAPTRNDGKKMKKESTVMEADLDQAEVLLAAQELVDELQGMVEDVAEMQVQKLMPIVDAMKEQVGFEVAEAYNNAADGALGQLLDAMKTAKGAVENATLAARGEPVDMPAPTDMGMDDADMDPEAPMDDDMGPDEFGGDEAEAGEDNAVGRELKGESALANMERGALAEKKFLESKDKLFKMVESGQMSQTDFINVINELDLAEMKPEKYYTDQGYKDPYANVRKYQDRPIQMQTDKGMVDVTPDTTSKAPQEPKKFVPLDPVPDVGKDAPVVKKPMSPSGVQKMPLKKGDQGFDAMQNMFGGFMQGVRDRTKMSQELARKNRARLAGTST
tara:strand:- start:637 stop:1875 length:1239 start_codon:yes stop_codon:yes gene_type:complete